MYSANWGQKWLWPDRFSDLSDEVAHRILSFLTIRDLIRFGCASKRCRALCLSTPSLNFDKVLNAKTWRVSKRLGLLRSLERFWTHRGGDKVERFRIVWDVEHVLREAFSVDETFRVITWIHNAIKCNVEVLDLECGSYRVTQPFPACVFLCKSLRSLLVDSFMVLKAPSSPSLSNLECLKLRNVKIADEGFFKWISCSCKCIKELCLEQVSGVENITIKIPSLISFRFVCHSLTDPCHLSISAEKLVDLVIDLICLRHRKLIEIFAPNLKFMKWIGKLMIDQSLGELVYLQKAELFLKHGACDFDIVSEFLCSIRRVEVLILNEESLKLLPFLKKGSKPRPLDNVRYLRIHIGSLLDDLVLALVSLFKATPNLSTLHIKSDRIFLHPRTDSCGFNAERWKNENPAFVSQLKEVAIELSNGSNGIELSRYILEHAPNLEKMVIVHSPQQSHVRRKLNKRKRISNASLVFQKDQERGA